MAPRRFPSELSVSVFETRLLAPFRKKAPKSQVRTSPFLRPAPDEFLVSLAHGEWSGCSPPAGLPPSRNESTYSGSGITGSGDSSSSEGSDSGSSASDSEMSGSGDSSSSSTTSSSDSDYEDGKAPPSAPESAPAPVDTVPSFPASSGTGKRRCCQCRLGCKVEGQADRLCRCFLRGIPCTSCIPETLVPSKCLAKGLRVEEHRRQHGLPPRAGRSGATDATGPAVDSPLPEDDPPAAPAPPPRPRSSAHPLTDLGRKDRIEVIRKEACRAAGLIRTVSIPGGALRARVSHELQQCVDLMARGSEDEASHADRVLSIFPYLVLQRQRAERRR